MVEHRPMKPEAEVRLGFAPMGAGKAKKGRIHWPEDSW